LVILIALGLYLTIPYRVTQAIIAAAFLFVILFLRFISDFLCITYPAKSLKLVLIGFDPASPWDFRLR